MSSITRPLGPPLTPQSSRAQPIASHDEASHEAQPRPRKDFEKRKARPQSWFAKPTPKDVDLTPQAALTPPSHEASTSAMGRTSSRKHKVRGAGEDMVNRLSFLANRPQSHWFFGKQVVDKPLEDYISRLVADAAYVSDKYTVARSEIASLKARLDAESHKVKTIDADLVFYRKYHDEHHFNLEHVSSLLKEAQHASRQSDLCVARGLHFVESLRPPHGVSFREEVEQQSDAGDEVASTQGTFGFDAS